MATIIIFFPVATAFYDGLRRTEPGLLDLARTMERAPPRCCGGCACRRRCPRSPRGCASPRRSRRSARSSANGSAPPPASATSCCTPMAAARRT
jgi:hypothetical protein